MALSTLFYITITVFVIAIILNVVAIWMASKGLTRDDNNNFIPDILEEKFAELKKDVKTVSDSVKGVVKKLDAKPEEASKEDNPGLDDA